MRLKSKIIKAVYEGEELLAPGQHLAADGYGMSRSFTTSAEPILGAESQTVRAHGNAQGSLSLPVCVDLPNEPAAYAEGLRREAFAEAHQTGLLTVTVGDETHSWQAGITSVSWQLSYTSSNKVRLTFTYEFVRGARV